MNNYGLVESLAFNLRSGTCVRVWFNTMYELSSNVSAIRKLIEAKVNKYVDGVVSYYNQDGNPIEIKGSRTIIIETGYGNITLNVQDFIDGKIKFIELVSVSQPNTSEETKKNLTFTRKEFREIILKWINYVYNRLECSQYHISESHNYVHVHVYKGSDLEAYLQIEMTYNKHNNLVGYRIYDTDAKPNAPFIVIHEFTAATELRNIKKKTLRLEDAKQLFNFIMVGFNFAK